MMRFCPLPFTDGTKIYLGMRCLLPNLGRLCTVEPRHSEQLPIGSADVHMPQDWNLFLNPITAEW